MTEEKVIYEQGDIKITNLRAIFGDKTYAISNITSVTKKEKTNLSAFLPVAMIVVGIAFISFAFFEKVINWIAIGFGVLMVVGGYFVAMLLKTEYFVQIGSASGEEQANKSKSIAKVTEIVKAVNQAMIQQG
ncbi:MAG: DUF6232 family protein [Chloroflexota bacterium]|nr:DUF6232 family protein [Chloroflexota bacterium]